MFNYRGLLVYADDCRGLNTLTGPRSVYGEFMLHAYIYIYTYICTYMTNIDKLLTIHVSRLPVLYSVQLFPNAG